LLPYLCVTLKSSVYVAKVTVRDSIAIIHAGKAPSLLSAFSRRGESVRCRVGWEDAYGR